MKTKRPFWKKKRIWILILSIGFIFYAYWFLQLRLSPKEFKQQLKGAPYNYGNSVKSGDYKTPDGRNVHYTEIGNDSLPLVVLLHGSPASSFIWMGFLKDSLLLRNAKLLVVDRLGYGYSGLGKPETSIQKQAEAIMPLLHEKIKQHSELILVGSSYGATVAARLAMDCPDCIDGLLLQAGSTKPGAETIYSISYPATHWSLRWMIPAALTMANLEKLSHKAELEKMRPLWQNIKVPVTILHGADDKLIWPENASFTKEQLVNAPWVELNFVPKRGHNLTWKSKELVCQKIVALLGIAKARKLLKN